DLIMRWKPRLRIRSDVTALLVSAYLASGIYLTGSINLIGPRNYGDRKIVYYEYNRQRFAPGVEPFKLDSVIAGDPDFVDLALPAEQQRPLAGRFLEVNMVLDNEQRRIRFVLDQYLSGIDRGNLAAFLLKDYSTSLTREERAIYLHTFDDVSRDPDRFIDD